ncbi:MAG TPA: hypothetical protein VJ843_00670 [Candidatus Saccharimonadales bacterium]|nr:hypothetical protein [Candidatus Saccharimonadales bacterium]
MKRQTLKAIGGVALAILVSAVFAQVKVSAQVQNGNEALVGSWDVQVTIRDCQTGTPLFSFPAMMTYNQGDTMQETDLGDPFLVRLLGHGVWEHDKKRQYSAAFQFLNYNPDRTFAGRNVIRSAISLGQGGDTYTGTDTLEILDANGNVIARGCATTTATRFK